MIALGAILIGIGLAGLDVAYQLGLQREGRISMWTFLAGLACLVLGVMP